MSLRNGTLQQGPSWLCGVTDSSPPGKNSSWFINSCTADLVPLATHLTFSLSSFLVLMVLPCLRQNVPRTVRHTYHLRYPGHVARWLLYILYFHICLCMLGEGVLTAAQVTFDIAPVLRLYMLPVAAIVAAVAVMVYDHRMEYWNRPGMCILKLVYWACLLAAECLRLVALQHDNRISPTDMRWIINKVLIGVASIMCIMELYLVAKKVKRRKIIQMFGVCTLTHLKNR